LEVWFVTAGEDDQRGDQRRQAETGDLRRPGAAFDVGNDLADCVDSAVSECIDRGDDATTEFRVRVVASVSQVERPTTGIDDEQPSALGVPQTPPPA
jgi:hypothetical protein